MALVATEAIVDGFHARKRPLDETSSDQIQPPARRSRRVFVSDISEPLNTAAARNTTRQSSTTSPVRLPQTLPKQQHALLLHEKKQPYSLTASHIVPSANEEQEVVVKILAIGLNPIDWKAPDFGFGIPTLPYVAGRDFIGIVTTERSVTNSTQRKIRRGDLVLAASTDYRDLRKAAYQEYAVASTSNLCRLPSWADRSAFAGLGVAFIAAALALGICLGTDFSSLEPNSRGPNLRAILRGIDEVRLPQDIRDQCLRDATSERPPQKGEWLAIWGGSSTTAFLLAQLAKLSGLRVITIVDLAKHGAAQYNGLADFLVDSHDPDRAVTIVRSVTDNRLRFAVDTSGKDTASHLSKTLQSHSQNVEEQFDLQSHLVGLTGLPKDGSARIVLHSVPIKLHHEIEEIGEALMVWLEALIRHKKILAPKVEVIPGGLASVNDALDRMRRGEVAGKRLVVDMRRAEAQ